MTGLLRLTLGRLVGVLLNVFTAVTAVFWLVQLVPGDPAQAALAQSNLPEAALEARRTALGLDEPLVVQYGRYLGSVLRGDLGQSWVSGQPVSTLIGQGLAATLELAGLSLLLGVGLALPLGVLAAASRSSTVRSVTRAAAGAAVVLPPIVVGSLLLWGTVSVSVRPRLLLPVLTVAVGVGGALARVIEADVGAALRSDWVRAIRMKGRTHLHAVGHALRVGLLPALDVLALQFGFLIGGTVVTEVIFARPGVGRLLVDAVLNKDLPVLQAVVILSVAGYGVLVFVSDVARAALDPRIRA